MKHDVACETSTFAGCTAQLHTRVGLTSVTTECRHLVVNIFDYSGMKE